jgi:hypothetical protein
MRRWRGRTGPSIALASPLPDIKKGLENRDVKTPKLRRPFYADPEIAQEYL